MEEKGSIFTLSVDAAGKYHLKEAAKWAKFLSILGMVLVGLMIIGSVTSITLAGRNYSESNEYGFSPAYYAGVRFGQTISALIAPVIAFFPLLFLLQFSNKAKAALAADDQTLLSECFQSLKKYFRYLGIIAIIFIVMMVLVFVFMGLAFMR